MEKLAYLLVGPAGSVWSGLGDSLHGPTVSALRSLGAHRIQVNVADDHLGPPFGVAPDEGDQLLGAVFAWVDSAEGTAAATALPDPGEGGAKWYGYLVSESEPLPNTAHPPGPDGRVAGFAQLVALIRPSHLSWGEWRRIWQGGHTTVALNTQSTFRYVQNVVFRALTPGAPPYAAIVEECFPLEAATDLHVFFDSGGDDAKLARHMAAMSESCDRFMDGSAPVVWTSEWVFGP